MSGRFVFLCIPETNMAIYSVSVRDEMISLDRRYSHAILIIIIVKYLQPKLMPLVEEKVLKARIHAHQLRRGLFQGHSSFFRRNYILRKIMGRITVERSRVWRCHQSNATWRDQS